MPRGRRNDPGTLITNIASLLCSPILMTIGLFLIFAAFKTESLVCNRTGEYFNNCEYFQNTLFETTSVMQFPLSQVKEARLEVFDSPLRGRDRCNLVIEKEILEFAFSGCDDISQKEKMVSKINAFLQSPKQSSLSVKEWPNVHLIIWGIIFSFCGFCIACSSLYFIYLFLISFVNNR